MTEKKKEVEKVERETYDEAAPAVTLPSQMETVQAVEAPAEGQPEAVPVPEGGAEPYPPETASEASPVSTEAPVNEGTAPVASEVIPEADDNVDDDDAPVVDPRYVEDDEAENDE